DALPISYVVLDVDGDSEALRETRAERVGHAIDSEVDGVPDRAGAGIDLTRDSDPDLGRRAGLEDQSVEQVADPFADRFRPRRPRLGFDPQLGGPGEGAQPDGGTTDIDADSQGHRSTTPRTSRMAAAAAPARTMSSIRLASTVTSPAPSGRSRDRSSRRTDPAYPSVS